MCSGIHLPCRFSRSSLLKKLFTQMWMSTRWWLTCPSSPKPSSSQGLLLNPSSTPRKPGPMAKVSTGRVGFEDCPLVLKIIIGFRRRVLIIKNVQAKSWKTLGTSFVSVVGFCFLTLRSFCLWASFSALWTCWFNVTETDSLSLHDLSALTPGWRKDCSHFSEEESEAWSPGGGRVADRNLGLLADDSFFLWLC